MAPFPSLNRVTFRAGFLALVLPCLLGGADTAQAQSACEHGICFRFPGEDPTLFDPPSPGLLGPLLMDHWQEGDPGYCRNYLGQDFDNCYREHRGADFMLLGGFREMANDIPVVAAADGEIIAIEDQQFDHCHGSILDLLTGGDGISCGIDPTTGEPRPQKPNYVKIRHWNGRYYVYSLVYHLKKDSVPEWIKAELSQNGAVPIKCGERIGYVGSAGTSFAPHIHFEVRMKEGDTVGDLTDTYAIDPYCGDYTPSQTYTMWTSLENTESLPGTTCQAPYDPLEAGAPTQGQCFKTGSRTGSRQAPQSRPPAARR